MIRAALIGNPNVGKTEIFNRLTGLSQKVGNFPGVTVEKKSGKAYHKGHEIEVIDLPGTYSLSCRALDEIVARDFIIDEKPDVVVDIVDGTSLERNLYLTLLLQEMEANLIIALNRWDSVRARNIVVNLSELSDLLGCPVVPTVAITGEGLDDLMDAIVDYALKSENDKAKSNRYQRKIYNYGDKIEPLIERVEKIVLDYSQIVDRYPSRWLAIKLLEGDEKVISLLEKSTSELQMKRILENVEKAFEHEQL